MQSYLSLALALPGASIFTVHDVPRFEKANKGSEVLAFHGTSSGVVDSILKENLQLKYAKREAHGKGNYFSEFPDTSMGYGDALLLFRVLPGKEYTGPDKTWTSFDSKKVGGDVEGFGDMLIVQDSSQFVPYAVYNLKRL